jgi:hypothetical protein
VENAVVRERGSTLRIAARLAREKRYMFIACSLESLR